jgi:hypothetical protein
MIRNKKVKTRKDHECFACFRKISAGEIAHIQTYANYDGIYNIYLCDRCVNWCNDKNCNDCYDVDGYIDEGYVKYCEEHI